MALFTRKKEQPAIEIRDNGTENASILDAILNGQYSNGGAVTSISSVFAAVELISNSIAELPIVVKKDGELDKEHPLNYLWDSAIMGKFNLMKQLIYDLIIYGEALVYVEGSKEMPKRLIYCEHGSYQTIYNQQKQELRYSIPFLKKSNIDDTHVLRFYKNSQNGVEGKAILSYAKRIFDLCKYTDTAASSYFASGCNLNGILTVTGNPSTEEIEKIRTNWKRLHSGDGSTGLAILKGNMKYEDIGSSASESQMLESRLFNVSEVARFFNINPVLLGDLSKSSYSTIEAANLEFVTHTLLPYITLIECELNRKLIPESQRGIYKIDLDENYLLRTDKTATASYLNTLVGGGILSINEARTQLGYNAIEGGDKHIIAYTDINQNTIDNNSSDEEETK